ncbi:MAG: hypothetical protein ACYSWO_07870 [Planctomycetota bacterium]
MTTNYSHLDQLRRHSFAFDTSGPMHYNPTVSDFFNGCTVSGFSAREMLDQDSEKKKNQFMQLSLNAPVIAGSRRRT